MTDLNGDIGGLTMTVADSPYDLTGDAWVLDGSLWSSESGVVVRAMGNYGISVMGHIAMSGVTFSSGMPAPARNDWRGIWIQHKAENIFMDNIVRHAVVGVEIVGYGVIGGVQSNLIRDCPGIGLFVCGYDPEALHSANSIFSCGSGMFVDYRGF